MQIKEKLEVFRDFTINIAKEQSGQLALQYEEACRQELEEYRKKKQTEMEQKVRMEERNIRRQLNSRVSGELLRQKHMLEECRRQWKKKLGQQVKGLLAEYQKTQEYQEYLLAKINLAKEMAGKEPVTIYLNPSDAAKKEKLEQTAGVTLTVSSVDFVGGIRAVIPSRNLLIDESFGSKLEQEEMYL